MNMWKKAVLVLIGNTTAFQAVVGRSYLPHRIIKQGVNYENSNTQ